MGHPGGSCRSTSTAGQPVDDGCVDGTAQALRVEETSADRGKGAFRDQPDPFSSLVEPDGSPMPRRAHNSRRSSSSTDGTVQQFDHGKPYRIMRSYVYWQKVVDTLTAAPLRTTVGKVT